MTQINRLKKQRQRRQFRVTNRVKRDSTRLRLCVTRSLKNISAQVIDDEKRVTIASVSTLEKSVRETVKYGGNSEAAAAMGKLIAERALEAGVKQVTFDRRENRYHGRIAALADAARDAGLDIGAKKVVVEKKPEKKSKGKGKRKKG